MRLFISRFIYWDNTSERQTPIILGPDPKGPCGQSELFEARQWQELNPRPADDIINYQLPILCFRFTISI
mgnify:CR=1 FL=1